MPKTINDIIRDLETYKGKKTAAVKALQASNGLVRFFGGIGNKDQLRAHQADDFKTLLATFNQQNQNTLKNFLRIFSQYAAISYSGSTALANIVAPVLLSVIENNKFESQQLDSLFSIVKNLNGDNPIRAALFSKCIADLNPQQRIDFCYKHGINAPMGFGSAVRHERRRANI